MSIASSTPLTSTYPSVVAPEATWDSLKRFTVAEYHAMIEAGVFAEDENFELLDGLIVEKMTKHPPHWIAVELLRQALEALRIPGFFVHVQNPVTFAASNSEPEPDLALVRGKLRDYLSGNPDPTKSPLVIEVAESSLSKDRRWKKRIYARAGIPVYWIVNLIDRKIEVYAQPSGEIAIEPDYATCVIFDENGEVPVVVEGAEVGWILVKDVLP